MLGLLTLRGLKPLRPGTALVSSLVVPGTNAARCIGARKQAYVLRHEDETCARWGHMRLEFRRRLHPYSERTPLSPSHLSLGGECFEAGLPAEAEPQAGCVRF